MTVRSISHSPDLGLFSIGDEVLYHGSRVRISSMLGRFDRDPDNPDRRRFQEYVRLEGRNGALVPVEELVPVEGGNHG